MGLFVPLGVVGIFYWSCFTSSPVTNDVYAFDGGPGDVYVRTGGVGSFTALGSTRAWAGCCATASGDIYASTNPGDIYKRVGGVGSFVPTGQTTRYWNSMATAPNGDIYAIAWTSGSRHVYKQAFGDTTFVDTGWPDKPGSLGNGFPVNDGGIAITAASDIYISESQFFDEIWKGTAANNFTSIYSNPSIVFSSLTKSAAGDLYLIGSVGGVADIYKMTGAAAPPVAMGEAALDWRALGAAANGDLYAGVFEGDIYVYTAPAINAPVLTSVTPGVGKNTLTWTWSA